MPEVLKAMWYCAGALGTGIALIFVWSHARRDFEILVLFYSVIFLMVLLPLALACTVIWRLGSRAKPLPEVKHLPTPPDRRAR